MNHQVNHTTNSSVFFAAFFEHVLGDSFSNLWRFCPNRSNLAQWHYGHWSFLAAFAACLAGLCPFLRLTVGKNTHRTTTVVEKDEITCCPQFCCEFWYWLKSVRFWFVQFFLIRALLEIEPPGPCASQQEKKKCLRRVFAGAYVLLKRLRGYLVLRWAYAGLCSPEFCSSHTLTRDPFLKSSLTWTQGFRTWRSSFGFEKKHASISWEIVCSLRPDQKGELPLIWKQLRNNQLYFQGLPVVGNPISIWQDSIRTVLELG